MNEPTSVVGSGPARVLVLHSWTMDSSVWQRTVPLMDTERYTYALLDFPGYGRAISAAPAAGIDEMAEAGLAAADRLGWHSFAVLGHSMGGTAALRMASLAAGRVERVCALAPVAASGFPVDAESHRRFAGAWPEAGWIFGFVSPGLGPAELAELERLSATSLTKRAWEQYLDNWTGARFADALVGLRTPVTFLLGEHDPIATPDHLASTVAALVTTEVITLAGAAHFPMIERPEASVRAWEKALAAVGVA